MRVFQIISFYPEYFSYFSQRYPQAAKMSYAGRLQLILEHHYGASHILEPVYSNDPHVVVTVANDYVLQGQWAKEHGMSSQVLTEILLAQIEEHQAEVVYNLDPMQYDSSFVKRLPGCVKKTICWRAAPIGRADLSAFDLRVSNFPPFLRKWEAQGLRAAYFSPSHDPKMEDFAIRGGRPVDISFAGRYSPLHLLRNNLLEMCASLSSRYQVVFALTYPKRKPFLNVPLIRRIPGFLQYLPKILRKIAIPPVYGLELYELFAKSKIVINGAIDMSEQYRVNMRCFEAMGCGACMLSDEGIYPQGFIPGRHFETFRNHIDAIQKIETLLTDNRWKKYATLGNENLKAKFSKSMQWEAFQKMVSGI